MNSKALLLPALLAVSCAFAAEEASAPKAAIDSQVLAAKPAEAKEVPATPPPEAKPAAPKAHDPEIMAQLSSLTEKAKDLRTFTARFTQHDKDPLFMDETESEGLLSFQRKIEGGQTGCFLRFDYEKPQKSVTMLTPKCMLVYTADMVEPQITQVSGQNSADILFSTFVTPDQLSKHYSFTKLAAKEGCLAFHLVPESHFVKRFFKEAEVVFSSQSGLPVKIRQIKLNGQDITLDFAEAKLNPELPSGCFNPRSLVKKD